jgi:hypothetical protein
MRGPHFIGLIALIVLFAAWMDPRYAAAPGVLGLGAVAAWYLVRRGSRRG